VKVALILWCAEACVLCMPHSFSASRQSFGVRKPCLRLNGNKAEAWLSCQRHDKQSTYLFRSAKLTWFEPLFASERCMRSYASIFWMPAPLHLIPMRCDGHGSMGACIRRAYIETYPLTDCELGIRLQEMNPQ